MEGASGNAVVRWKLIDSRKAPRIRGEQPLPGSTSYFRSPNPSEWPTGIRSFARVRYQTVYPGIDLVYYGNGADLEYDFVLAPGADPSLIRLSYSGVRKVELANNGDVLIRTSAGDLVQRAPRIYQKKDGRDVPVRGRYRVAGNELRFSVARYDTRRELVIDPILSYSSTLGGVLGDNGYDVALDANGNIYIAGDAYDSDFPATGAVRLGTGSQLATSATLVKLNPSATTRIYTVFLGSGYTSAKAVAVDAAGNVFLAGQSSGLPVTANAAQPNPGGADDCFVAKINPAGNSLLYATYLGGAKYDYVSDLLVEPGGTAFLVGSAEESPFPTAPPPVARHKGAGFDGFVARIAANGSQIEKLTYIGAADSLNDAAFDSSGNLYVTGAVTSTLLATTAGVAQPKSAGASEAYVGKLTRNLDVVFLTYLGGQVNDIGVGIAVSPTGVYVTGTTGSSNFPVTPNAIQTQFKGGAGDGFVTKLSLDGTAILSSTLLGSKGYDLLTSVAVDKSDNVYLGGTLYAGQPDIAPDFPVSPDALLKTPAGGNDIIFAKLGPSGSSLDYSTLFGGSKDDKLNGDLAIDGQGRALFTGVTLSSDFPATADALQPQRELSGFSDRFLVRLDPPNRGPVITEVVDGGSLLAGISASAWVTIKGSNLAQKTRIWAGPDFVGNALPTKLDQVSVTIDGKPAAVYYISPAQLNVLAPALTKTGSVQVVVTAPAGVASFTATVRARTPSWFMLDPENRRYVAAVLLDGTIIGKPGLYPSAPNATKPLPARGTRAYVYGTGWGPTNPPQPENQLFSGAYPITNAANIHLTIGGKEVVVEFAGAVSPGLYQFNIVSPDLPPGDYAIEGTIGNVTTQTGAFITIGPAQ